MSLARQRLIRAAPSVLATMRPRAFQPGPASFLAAQKRLLSMQPTRRLMRQSEHEDRAHTVSQRIRQLKKIPVELLPLGVVLIVALVAAVYSLFSKLWTDKTLRLWRSNRSADD